MRHQCYACQSATQRCLGCLPVCMHQCKGEPGLRGIPWLTYDSHFRRVATASKLTSWSQANTSLLALYFTYPSKIQRAWQSSPHHRRRLAGRRRRQYSRVGVQQVLPVSFLHTNLQELNYKHCSEASCRFWHICI